jgi:uncharacterized protein (TIGR00251 family)
MASLTVQITPNARRNEVIGWMGDRLKIKIKAPAVEGKANEELRRFLAEWLAIRPSDITILRGDTSRTKHLQIEHIDDATLIEKTTRGAAASSQNET